MNRDEQKWWLWIFSNALPLPDSVNEIVFVYSWLRLAFSRQCNLSLPHWLDSCLIHTTWKCLYSSVHCGFPQRSEENRWGPHADSSSRAPVSLRQRIQSAGTKCACVCLCSCYHRGMWDLHLKQLSLRPDPISHCKGALLLSHLCHTGSLRLLELYIMCFRVCVCVCVWKEWEERCWEGYEDVAIGERTEMPAVIYLNAGQYTYLMIQAHLVKGRWSRAFVCNCGCTVTLLL